MGFRRDSHRRNSQAWRPHFLQLIVHSTVHDGQLVIPVEFVQQLGEDLSDSAVLKVPNGKEWVVGLKKIDGVVWFHNGLQQFLEYHNISVGYFLVFRYEGDSQFLVLIFSRNACEIQYTLQESNLHDKHLILENEEREGDTSTSLRMTIIDGHEEQQTFQESNLHDKHLNLENEESGEELDTPTSLNLENEERGEEEDTPTSLNLENEKRGEKEDTPTSLRMTIIDGHEEQHTKRTSKTQGKRSSAYSGIPVSKHDCIAKKKRKRNEIVGKRTKPNASGEKVTKELENQQIAQRGGNTASLGRLEDEYEWASLRKERPVTKEERERAISASMLLKPKNPSFMVIMTPSYLRKGMNVPLKFSRNHFKDGLHHVKLRLPNGSTWPARFFLRSNVKALLSGGWNAFARENILLEGDCCVFEVFKKKNIEMKVSIFRVVEDWVPLVGSVTAKTRHPITFEESKATQAAREFKSKYPFYTVYMHRSYIRSRVMIMRQDFFKKHMPEEVETITLKDSDGRQWPVKLYSTNDGRAHRFGEGWSAFVKGKTIEEGDVCVFELVKKKDTVLKVSILKKH
ncbi:B3 domain-containing protein Os03g0620400-like [Macadamia integrifolia]|uniref:B3 domain-containing protein Os03g0620400-like n=1 Tax=Macadamia integrifolia TaxID=60698 RepID=UPI001C4F1120|nr:B3 domain-containing protein Os03g0620400-like [Macadamia integrifolia]